MLPCAETPVDHAHRRREEYMTGAALPSRRIHADTHFWGTWPCYTLLFSGGYTCAQELDLDIRWIPPP